MNTIKKVCVYCASSSRVNSEYIETAKTLGRILAENDLELIYGAGSSGLMGTIADSVLEHGGSVTGVIPRFMVEVEWQHDGLSKLILTETMHERKEMMANLADAVVALPGGCGTMEELLEMITWKQLGIHSQPIVIVNVNGYYDHLLALFERAANEQFMRHEHLKMWAVANNAYEVLDAIRNQDLVHEDMRQFAKI